MHEAKIDNKEDKNKSVVGFGTQQPLKQLKRLNIMLADIKNKTW